MPRVCVHLDGSTDWDYAHFFDGTSLDYALICLACRADQGAIEGNLKVVAPERFAAIEQGGYWDWDKSAIIGRPPILERPTRLRFEHQEVGLTGAILGGIADLS